MKITEETKLKDLIPEGYGLSDDGVIINTSEILGRGDIRVLIKNKEDNPSPKVSIEVVVGEDRPVAGLTGLDFIAPDGYEIVMPDPKEAVYILRKKEVKDFNWYVNKYFLTRRIYPYDAINIESCLFVGDFDKVCFEVKIGLLNYICEDINVDLSVVLFEMYQISLSIDRHRDAVKIQEICPQAFLDSMFRKPC